MMNTFFKKSILAAMVIALAFAALPVTSVFAADDPTSPQPQISNAKLEKIWARELKIYDRLGKAFDHSDAVIEKVQALIDKAAENGKDVTAVQAALDAFVAAIKKAHPLYESTKGIVNSHKGFDENGKVTDSQQAQETVRAMRDALKHIKDSMGGTGRALREAIKANRHVPKYLSGKAAIPDVLPESYSLGSVEEAVFCADEFFEAWGATPGADRWLQSSTPLKSKTHRKKPGRR